MAKTYEFIHIYNGLDSEVAVAPKGSTYMEGIGPAEDPFEEVGWLSEDGVSEETSADQEPFRAFQGSKIVKRIIPEAETSFTFQCLEANAVVHGLKTRGATTTVEAGVAKTVRDRETAVDERTWRVRTIADDGTEAISQFVGVHSQSGAIEKTATGLTVYEYTVSPIGDITEYTNHPGIVGDAGDPTP